MVIDIIRTSSALWRKISSANSYHEHSPPPAMWWIPKARGADQAHERVGQVRRVGRAADLVAHDDDVALVVAQRAASSRRSCGRAVPKSHELRTMK